MRRTTNITFREAQGQRVEQAALAEISNGHSVLTPEITAAARKRRKR
jgi:hypothetical protein